MYHYLKWAAISLFFKRNLRSLILMALALLGIFVLNAVYGDLVDYLVATRRQEQILTLLLVKWLLILILAGVLVYGALGLGISRAKEQEKPKKRPKKSLPNPLKPISETTKEANEERIRKRLEKFKDPRKLRRKSDQIIERLEKKGIRRQ